VVKADGTVANGGVHNHRTNNPGHTHDIIARAGSDGGGGAITEGNVDNSKTVVASEEAKTNVTVIGGEGSHDHVFTGKQVTSGDASKNHTHTLTLSGSTGNSTGSSSVSVPVSVSTVPVYYTMIYIKKMV
jgi:hypothetical protein